jgi:hypothetical protein
MSHSRSRLRRRSRSEFSLAFRYRQGRIAQPWASRAFCCRHHAGFAWRLYLEFASRKEPYLAGEPRGSACNSVGGTRGTWVRCHLRWTGRPRCRVRRSELAPTAASNSNCRRTVDANRFRHVVSQSMLAQRTRRNRPASRDKYTPCSFCGCYERVRHIGRDLMAIGNCRHQMTMGTFTKLTKDPALTPSGTRKTNSFVRWRHSRRYQTGSRF